MKLAKWCLPFSIVLLSYQTPGADDPVFESAPKLFPITPGIIDEASGIADSYSNVGFLWVELDSDNPPVLHLLKHDGKHGHTVFLKGIQNRDWEDIALSNGPQTSKKYLYLAETGDNNQVYAHYAIYRFIEPKIEKNDTVSNINKIQFKYPDGSHDAEAILVDGASKDIFIITKRDNFSKVYKLSYPSYESEGMHVASHIMDLPYKGVTSAAISPAQDEILIKTYSKVYYYKRKSGETIEQTLQHNFRILPYQVEAQGEAICFSNQHDGFFTLSEKSFLPSAQLNFYKRK
jgi:hypothetical protein